MAIKAVSRREPCPICGRTDWCGIMQSDYGYPLYVCQRSSDKWLNDPLYVQIGTSESGSTTWCHVDNCKKHSERKQNSEYVRRPKTYIDFSRVLPNDKLHEIYSAMDKLLKLEDFHREYLHREGWSDELIERHHIVSLPEADYLRFKKRDQGAARQSYNPYRRTLGSKLAEQFGSLAGVPGAYLKETKDGSYWTFHGRSGILFPIYDSEGKQYRKRIRLDYEDSADMIGRDEYGRYFFDDNEKLYITMSGIKKVSDGVLVTARRDAKYNNLASKREEEDDSFVINKLKYGCEAGNNLSLYCTSQDDYFCAYITEGEKKGMFGNYRLHSPFITLPGVNSYSKLLESEGKKMLEVLKDRGTKCLIVAFDADKAVNERVLKCETETVRVLKDLGFSIGVAEWNGDEGKGIDDALLNGAKISFVVP